MPQYMQGLIYFQYTLTTRVQPLEFPTKSMNEEFIGACDSVKHATKFTRSLSLLANPQDKATSNAEVTSVDFYPLGFDSVFLDYIVSSQMPSSRFIFIFFSACLQCEVDPNQLACRFQIQQIMSFCGVDTVCILSVNSYCIP